MSSALEQRLIRLEMRSAWQSETIVDLAARVRSLEQTSRSVPGGGYSSGGGGGNVGVVRAVVTTSIPTGTFSTPSTTGGAQLYAPDGSGGWATNGSPVVVKNDHVLSASVAVGKTIKVVAIGPDWWLITADC